MTNPITVYAGARQTPPLKYNERFYLRDIQQPLPGLFNLAKLRIRCRIDDDGGDPLYGPFDIPTLAGYKALGIFAPPFSINSNSGDPTASDSPVVRPIFALRGPKQFELYLYDPNSPGTWPGPLDNSSLESPHIHAAASKLGGPADFQASRGAPATLSLMRPTRVIAKTTITTGDPSDPSDFNTYKLTLASGVTIRVDVNVLADQPVLGQPWPLDQEEERFNYMVNVVQQMQQELYPKRNAFIVPTLSDLPGHNERGAQQHRPLVVTAVREVSNLPENSEMVQEVALNDGQSIRVPLSVTVVVGQEYDPSGTDPSAVLDPSFQQQALNPGQWWEFDVFIVLVPDMEQDGTLGAGFAADVWPLLP